MTCAMLLCAGLGTRLGPLSDERPKPMLPVCDIPIVRYGIALCVGHGIRDIVINLHHMGDVIERELGDGSALGARIRYSYEPEILGTGGGLKHALPLLDPDGTDEPIVSLNGKLIFDVDLGAVVEAYARIPDARGMMVVREIADAESWGAVDVDTSGLVPRVRNILGSGQFMFCGVHVTRPSMLRRLPDGEACMVRQGYLPWIEAGGLVAAFAADPGLYFAEHSTPRRYLESNIALLSGAPLRFAPGDLGGVHPRAKIAPSAIIRQPVQIGAGAIIGADAIVGPNAVIGAGALIDSCAHVHSAVVWPGAEARGTHEDCIITTEAVVSAH